MLEPASLDRIVTALDKEYSMREKAARYLQECKSNIKFEAVCIGVCEVGELGSEMVAYALDAPFMNEMGLLGGTLLGFSYAFTHVWRHRKKHMREASPIDAGLYALTTESSCVLSATGVEYAAGKFFTLPGHPFSATNLGIRVASLPIAFLIGLAAMSGLTFRKKDEAYWVICEKDVLGSVHTAMKDVFTGRIACSLINDSIVLDGRKYPLVLQERDLPRSYSHMLDSQEKALYVATTPAVRYAPEIKKDIAEVVNDCFTVTGKPFTAVPDIFAHGVV